VAAAMPARGIRRTTAYVQIEGMLRGTAWHGRGKRGVTRIRAQSPVGILARTEQPAALWLAQASQRFFSLLARCIWTSYSFARSRTFSETRKRFAGVLRSLLSLLFFFAQRRFLLFSLSGRAATIRWQTMVLMRSCEKEPCS